MFMAISLSNLCNCIIYGNNNNTVILRAQGMHLRHTSIRAPVEVAPLFFLQPGQMVGKQNTQRDGLSHFTRFLVMWFSNSVLLSDMDSFFFVHIQPLVWATEVCRPLCHRLTSHCHACAALPLQVCPSRRLCRFFPIGTGQHATACTQPRALT